MTFSMKNAFDIAINENQQGKESAFELQAQEQLFICITSSVF